MLLTLAADSEPKIVRKSSKNAASVSVITTGSHYTLPLLVARWRAVMDHPLPLLITPRGLPAAHYSFPLLSQAGERASAGPLQVMSNAHP